MTSKDMHNAQHWYEYGLVRAPGLVRLALEWRAPWELGAAVALRPLLNLAPAGDGHPVLVYPGLMASDITTAPLRSFLESRGYVAYGWGLKTNLGPRAGVLDACRARLAEIRKRHKRRISLLGWSLGGLYAREFAKELAPPRALGDHTGHAVHRTSESVERVAALRAGHRRQIGAPEVHAPLRVPPPVPVTSIFSRSDGVVAWQCCVEKEGPLHENIEVEASHLGLGFNPLAWYAIADRLAQPEGKWRHFDRSAGRAWLYRDPKRSGWF